MNVRLSVMTLALIAGCSSNPERADVVPVPLSADQRHSLAKAGESVIYEGYVYNGVVVTPQRNYYYGQTMGLAPGEVVQGDCFISDLSREEGGEIAKGCEEKPAPVEQAEAVPIEVPMVKPEQIEPRPEEVKPTPIPPVSSGNPFYDEILRAYLGIDPRGASNLMDRALSYANAPTPHFDAGSVVLKPADRRALEEFGDAARALGEPTIVLISGYTSAEGPRDLNERLAKGRADVVRNVLVGRGFWSDFLLSFAEPQCCYLNNNSTPAERAANRRVELSPGGRYADTEAFIPYRIAMAMARVKKHMNERPMGTVRVHVQASTLAQAKQVMDDVRSVMNNPQVGFRSIEAGYVSLGDKDNVIIEVKP